MLYNSLAGPVKQLQLVRCKQDVAELRQII